YQFFNLSFLYTIFIKNNFFIKKINNYNFNFFPLILLLVNKIKPNTNFINNTKINKENNFYSLLMKQKKKIKKFNKNKIKKINKIKPNNNFINNNKINKENNFYSLMMKQKKKIIKIYEN